MQFENCKTRYEWAIVGAIGPLRKIVRSSAGKVQRYLVIAPVVDDKPGTAIQVQR